MTRGATTSRTFFWACLARPGSAARPTVREGFDQRLEALGRLIAVAEDGDVDQWHEEPDEDSGVRDYVHVSLPPTTKAAPLEESAAFCESTRGGHEKSRV